MEKFKIGIMGCGRIATIMATTLKGMDDICMYAVASRDYERAQNFAKDYGFEKAYKSYIDMLNDPEIELIYIATPHSHHYEHIKLCLEHGKNVLCEKAFTVNTVQAIEVIKLAEDKKLLLTEAMWVRYMPMAKTLKSVIDSGIIGETTTLTANLHYVIDSKERMVKPELAGGSLLDVGVYALTFASIVFGDDIDKISASAVMTNEGVDSQVAATIIYNDKKMAIVNAGMSSLSDRKGIIYGRKGYIIVENINNFESITVYDIDRNIIKEIEAPAQITGYEYEVLACMDAIRAGNIVCEDMPHEETIKIMKQMDEIRKQIGLTYPGERGLL